MRRQFAAIVGIPFACSWTFAAELNVSVTSAGRSAVPVDPGAVVSYEVTGVLTDTANEGLSQFILDLALEPDGEVLPVVQPTGMAAYTSVNPDGGYAGTLIDGVLRQVGGAQDTLKMRGGSVVTGIGHTPTLLATGTLTAPLADGLYTLKASNVLGRVIVEDEDGSGEIWATEWTFWDEQLLPLTIAVGDACIDVAGCADQDGNGIRDGPCTWWSCGAGVCNGVDIVFADVGGQFGSCIPDGTADGNDKFHTLNCFSNQSTSGSSSYPCESAPPAAFNVDAGGPFGDCNPDGVCDGNDAFHALNAFGGTTLCSCPGGPAPGFEPQLVGRAGLVLKARRTTVRPGELVEVDVFLDGALADLRGYQLHLAARGDGGAGVELADISIEDRKDWVFAERGGWKAFNRSAGQMVAGLDTAGVAASSGAYLATFTYKVSDEAAGKLYFELVRPEASGRTFLFPTAAHGKIEARGAKPALVEMRDSAARGRDRMEDRP